MTIDDVYLSEPRSEGNGRNQAVKPLSSVLWCSEALRSDPGPSIVDYGIV